MIHRFREIRRTVLRALAVCLLLQLRDRHLVDIQTVADEMICGCPTNFSKQGGLNYYHVQHVVALIYLAVAADMSDETRSKLLHWVQLWHEAMEGLTVAAMLSFADPQDVLDGINRGKVLTQLEDWEAAGALMGRAD